MNLLLPKPLPHQLDFLRDKARFKVVCCGRRWGKSLAGLIACIEGHGGFKGAIEGGHIWWVAPNYKLASGIWRSLKTALRFVRMGKNEVERRISLPGNGSITVKSADTPDSLRGAGLDGVVIDEAAFCSEEVWTDVLRPALSDKQGWAIFISTPCGENWFYKLWLQAKDSQGWKAWQRPTSDNPKIKPEELEDAKRSLGTTVFNQEFLAHFQANKSGIFKRDWFRYYDSGETFQIKNQVFRPGDLKRFATVDLATSLKTSADFTVISSWGFHTGKLILLDVIRDRMEGPDIVPSIRKAVDRHNLSSVWIEKVGFQLSLIQEARRAGLPVRELEPNKDKVSRAMPATALMEGERVWFPRYAPWLSEIENELLNFPNGSHDDFVDTLSYAVAVSKQYADRQPMPILDFAPKPIQRVLSSYKIDAG